MNPRLRRAVEHFDLAAYVHQTFDHVIEASSGTELRVNCFSPKGCNGSDTGQHLWINIEKKMWICYKCGYGSSHEQPGTTWLPQFIADAEGKSLMEIKRRLTSQVEPTPTEGLGELLEGLFQDRAPAPQEHGEVDLPKAFAPLAGCEARLWAKPYFHYLKKRGIPTSVLTSFDVRCCFSSADRWKGRLIFPIWDLDGNTRSATGRAISSAREPRWTVWPKSDIQHTLWPLGIWAEDGTWTSLREMGLSQSTRPLVLVEGIIDAIAVVKAGPYPALATFGHKISEQQLAVLQELAPKEVTLAWDYDARAKMIQMVKRLQGRFDRVSVMPFRGYYWRENDLGYLLKLERERAEELLDHELAHRVDVDSSEFVSWATRMSL